MCNNNNTCHQESYVKCIYIKGVKDTVEHLNCS